MATDVTKTIEYPEMDPNEEIFGTGGLAKVLYILYGPNFDIANYTPLFNNIRTGAEMAKPHHCTHNDKQGHAMTRRCVTEGHQAYCLEFITEGGRRVRCGMRYKVVSGGCGSHPAHDMQDSKNLKIKNLISGKQKAISWGELNYDPEPLATTPSEAKREDETNQAILAKTNAELEALDTVGALPLGNHTAYSVHVAFEEDKIQKAREEQEQRKLAAAQRRSGATGHLEKVASTVEEAVTPESQGEQKRLFGRSLFKSKTKSDRPDPSKWANKRGGKNASEALSQE